MLGTAIGSDESNRVNNKSRLQTPNLEGEGGPGWRLLRGGKEDSRLYQDVKGNVNRELGWKRT